MKKILLSITILCIAIFLVACNDSTDSEIELPEAYMRNKTYAEDYYYLLNNAFFDENVPVLNHHYPNSGLKAYLWPYFSYMGFIERMISNNDDDETMTDLMNTYEALLVGLEYYNDTDQRTDGYTAYASGYGTYAKGVGDVFFDDNGWVMKKFFYAYELTGEQIYLTKTMEIFDYIVDLGWSEELGGVWWKEGRSDVIDFWRGLSATTPLLYVGLQLYQETNEQYYYDIAMEALEFIESLRNPANGVHWNAGSSAYVDGVITDTGINKDYWSYNSGFMLSSYVLLYKVTNDYSYIETAIETAIGTNQVFAFKDDFSGQMLYPDTAWFNALLLQGYADLYMYDKETVGIFIDQFDASLHWAMQNNTDEEGFLYSDWILATQHRNGRRDILDQTGIGEMFAILAYHYKNINRSVDE